MQSSSLWIVFRSTMTKFVLIALAISMEIAVSLSYKLDGDKVYQGMAKQMKNRGKQPPLTKTDETFLIPGSKWEADKCEVKKNMYRVKAPKCKPKVIDRGLCYGQCNSIYIPGSKLHFSQACLPEFKQTPVTLNCLEDGKRAMTVKFYEKIVACSCKKVTVDWSQIIRDIRTKFNSNIF